MNAEEFAAQYAARSGCEVEELNVIWGRYVEPCDCGEEGCEGWVMGFPWEDAILEDRARSDEDMLR